MWIEASGCVESDLSVHQEKENYSNKKKKKKKKKQQKKEKK